MSKSSSSKENFENYRKKKTSFLALMKWKVHKMLQKRQTIPAGSKKHLKMNWSLVAEVGKPRTSCNIVKLQK